MDAVEFLKERKRMCLSFGIMCTGCPLSGGYCANINDVPVEIYEKNVEAVEQWANDHPVKTRQSEFLKMFPNAFMDGGTVGLCPMSITAATCCNSPTNCRQCRQDYWLQEVE